MIIEILYNIQLYFYKILAQRKINSCSIKKYKKNDIGNKRRDKATQLFSFFQDRISLIFFKNKAQKS